MTKIKFCGLTRTGDIEAANELKPDYIGFVFWPKSKRAVTAGGAKILKSKLDPSIKAVGVFVDEDMEAVKSLLDGGIIDIAQLHGHEDEDYINGLKKASGKPVIKAFRIRNEEDIRKAEASPADLVLLDAGMGDGVTFDWSLIKNAGRPYFLAGGLDPDNAADAVRTLHPYALDVSSGVETDGLKDTNKMAAFAASVRKEDIT